MARNLNASSNIWSPVAVPDFAERVAYDPNGNILGYKRNGNDTWAGKSLGMDSLRYYYRLGTNQLDHITDSIPEAAYAEDIDTQNPGNYSYNSIGNLVSDQKEGLTIEWTVYGKIKKITKANGTVIEYKYDVSGSRIGKLVNGKETRYVKDASGNLLSLYIEDDNQYNGGKLTQLEIHLYGNGRLGVLRTELDVETGIPVENFVMPSLGTGYRSTFVRKEKLFELVNHLGSVLAAVTDGKHAVDDGTGLILDYLSDVVSAQDYYPFGMQMVGRAFESGKYMYGFNGKENDNEVKGEGNQLDYGMRIYDPRAGRFLSVDPLNKEYAWLSPYQYSSNSPVWSIDVDGLESDKKTDPANQPPAPIQTARDGFGDYFKRSYKVNLFNTKLTAKEIFEDIGKNFAKYTEGISYFEKVKGDKSLLAVGDEYAIAGGPFYQPITNWRTWDDGGRLRGFSEEGFAEAHKSAIDENDVYHSALINTGVTVKSINIQESEKIKSYSFTFSTWKGHVEAGEITFSLFQIGGDNDSKFIMFSIVSHSRSSNIVTDKAYLYLGGKEAQTEHWRTFLNSLRKRAGGSSTPNEEQTIQSAQPVVEKKTPEIKSKSY